MLNLKRDMDLVRQILLAVEGRPLEEDEVDITIDGYTTNQINYHLVILMDAGLIKAKYAQNLRDDYMWLDIRLTWEGHEFLDAARDNKRWEKAKGVLAQAGGFALDVMKQLLIQYLKQDLDLT
jgi:hypothetical protein